MHKDKNHLAEKVKTLNFNDGKHIYVTSLRGTHAVSHQ